MPSYALREISEFAVKPLAPKVRCVVVEVDKEVNLVLSANVSGEWHQNGFALRHVVRRKLYAA